MRQYPIKGLKGEFTTFRNNSCKKFQANDWSVRPVDENI